MTRSDRRASGRSATTLIVVIGFAVVLGLVELYAIQRFGRKAPPAEPATASVRAEAPRALGAVEEPAAESIRATRVRVSGWAVDSAGLRAVELRVGGRVHAARTGIERPDVAQTHPDFAEAGRAGFAYELDTAALEPAPGIDRRRVHIVAVANDGRETELGTRDLIAPAAHERWRRYASPDDEAFHLLPALSGIALGAANGLDAHYAAYVSPTTRLGTRVPILYLRTTQGAANDYAFDPDWDIERRCSAGASARRLSDDALNGVFRHAIDRKLPVLFTLNGGIWADAACDAPQWDVNDRLEQDAGNCQWNERNEVVGDDHLKNLAGAFESPELARALTLNVHANDVRRYKKRNLQQAARLVAAFARSHPELFVGVSLDPDLYVNPFFGEQAWFDYNPGTLRQFREWLGGSGPYAGRPGGGAPDLSAYRRAKPLTLAEAGRLAGRSFARWEDVDPPRIFHREGGAPFWEDRWVREWETFRRHLVDLHYDELSRWVAEAGIPRDRIWSSQGFMAPHASAMPFALAVASPVKNYDSGGMSVAGAKPAAGHLGAILYGPSARNAIRMEGPHSLFGAFAALDPRWAVVEYNSADLREPKVPPTYATAYQGLREMWNYGARFVSPMAWPGSSGRNAGKPGYDPFTAWRDTPLEEAAKDFLIARAHLAPGSKLWTFGSASHADNDGWSVERGTLASKPAHLLLAPDRDARVTLISPRELMLDRTHPWRVVLASEGAEASRVRILARASHDAPWTPIAEGPPDALTLPARTGGALDQLRLEMTFASAAPVALTRVAIVPHRPGRTSDTAR